jgi:spore germination protein GerM
MEVKMEKFNLGRRDYISLVIILLVVCYCLHLNAKLQVMESSLPEHQFSIRNHVEEGYNPEDFITLYFSDSNLDIIGEVRNIKELSPLKAVQALIEGPENKDLHRTLPIELEASMVKVEDGTAYVYIHESIPLEKHGDYGSSTASSQIINSICATLMIHEQFGIKKVKLEGDIWDILGIAVDSNKPFDIDMIQIKQN